MIRVLIIAAYASVRAGLRVLLAEADDLRIVEEVSGSAELERVLPDAHPDVVLLDDNERDAGRVLEVLEGGPAGLVVLGDAPGIYRVLAASALRGWSCLLKEADGAEIAGAVRAVAAGLIALDRSLGPRLVRVAPGTDLRPTGEAAPGEALTAREGEVLQLMAQGLPNKLIAARLGISLHTVKFHVAAVLAKLGAGSRTEAVTLGARRGFVSL